MVGLALHDPAVSVQPGASSQNPLYAQACCAEHSGGDAVTARADAMSLKPRKPEPTKAIELALSPMYRRPPFISCSHIEIPTEAPQTNDEIASFPTLRP